MNPEPDADAKRLRALISALADGQADAADCARGCAAWTLDEQAQRSWHAYHLIGDVLRSEDLAGSAVRDREFLDRLRRRLAAEPAVPAPAPELPTPASAAVPTPRRVGWGMPVALAAGVMALATVLVIGLGPAGRPGASLPMAAAPSPATVVAAGVAPGAPAIEATGLGSRIVRDAQLDRYLRAHRDYGTALPGSLPGGGARSITTVSLER